MSELAVSKLPTNFKLNFYISNNAWHRLTALPRHDLREYLFLLVFWSKNVYIKRVV